MKVKMVITHRAFRKVLGTPEPPMGQRRNEKISWANKKENKTYQNLRNAAKAVLRGRLKKINVYIKKKERSEINNLTLHLKKREKEQTKPKISRRKKIIKLREDINEKD